MVYSGCGEVDGDDVELVGFVTVEVLVILWDSTKHFLQYISSLINFSTV